MTAAPTASQILRSLDHHRAQAQFASLADLDAAHSDAVRRALSAVRPTSRIDVPKLLDSVRRDVAERAEAAAAKQPDLLAALRYRLSLASRGELESLRDELRERVEAGEGDQPFAPGSAVASIMSRLDSIRSRLLTRSNDVEPDDEIGGDEPNELPRRSIPRIRSKRAVGESADADTADGAPDQPPRPRTRPASAPGRLAQQLSGRVFSAYGDITSDEPDFPNPPWLLPDEPDESEASAA